MKERGIIFNAEMVKAILDGRKTQTRRIVKNVMLDNGIWLKKPTKTRSGTTTHVLDAPKHNLCPLGKIGDRLYVREAFKAGVCTESTIAYKATHKPSDLEEGWYEEIKWTPSIHMPRRYSRITLEITNIRVERLNDISNDDAKSEGCWYGRGGGTPDKALTPSDQFPTLWEEIYGDGSWSSNPWVWVIEFKRI
ncbi:hypothetical protein [Proteus sp. G2300]|uniref:hypothetical protein n=1 Tax=Proteus sp. G2300 TaxID=2698839 RepID=UPI001377B14D|nr:hypothetical protein [Proteus sp. G2300]NBN86017.1 hypothetical protein [Proteus sp. G2300]